MAVLEVKIQLPEPGMSIYPAEVCKKRIVIVEFKDATYKQSGKLFRWLPTYPELYEILGAMGKIEEESWVARMVETKQDVYVLIWIIFFESVGFAGAVLKGRLWLMLMFAMFIAWAVRLIGDA